MSKRQWLCLMGVWVMIFLFLGLPSLWHKIIALITGIVIIAIAYNLPYEKSKQSGNGSVFVENNNSNNEAS